MFHPHLNPPPSRGRRRRFCKSLLASDRGSLLITTVVVLAILSVFCLSVGYSVRQRLTVISRLEDREKLRLVAEAGIKKGIAMLAQNLKKNPQSQADTFNQDWMDNEKEFKEVRVGEGMFSIINFRAAKSERFSSDKSDKSKVLYGMVDEESKINLNQIQSEEVVKKLFESAVHLKEEDAQALAQSILDWIDEDDFSYEQGAESRYYRLLKPSYPAKNAKFGVLEELLYVKGMNPEIFEKILPFVTLYGTGRVNLNTAPQEVLSAIGISPGIAAKIVSFRRGPDAQSGTRDDTLFESLDIASIRRSLDLADQEAAELERVIQSGFLDMHSKVFSIHCVSQGLRGPQRFTVDAVVRPQGEILRWKEEFSSSL